MTGSLQGNYRCGRANRRELGGTGEWRFPVPRVVHDQDIWSVLILRDAFLGVRRFEQFVESLGIARNTLTSRLERLIGAGMLEPRPYQDNPVRYEYRLTEKGKELFDVLMTLWAYGKRWNPPADPDHQRAIHVDCGQEANTVAQCSHCGERLTRHNVRIEPRSSVLTEAEAADAIV